MLLFQFNKKDRCVMHPEALKLCKALKKVSKEQFLYIVLAYDYKSKFRLYPVKDRKMMAAREAFGSKQKEGFEEDPLLIEAIQEYMTLLFDYKRDMMDKYITKIQSLQSTFMLEDDPSTLKKIDGAIQGLEARIDSLQRDIDKDEEKEILSDGSEASEIELWQDRMKKNKLTKKKEKSPVSVFENNDIINFDDEEE